MAHIPDESDFTSRALRDRLIQAPAWPAERPLPPPTTTDTQQPV